MPPRSASLFGQSTISGRAPWRPAPLRRSLESEPDSETAHNELGYIEDLRRKREAEKEEIPWFLHSFVNPPTDPLTIRLLALVEDLPSIPGPKTVGSENYS